MLFYTTDLNLDKLLHFYYENSNVLFLNTIDYQNYVHDNRCKSQL